jgi:hypothetical protein
MSANTGAIPNLRTFITRDVQATPCIFYHLLPEAKRTGLLERRGEGMDAAVSRGMHVFQFDDNAWHAVKNNLRKSVLVVHTEASLAPSRWQALEVYGNRAY